MTAVLLAPHNDDETLFASFLILRYRPQVIVCLRSERMHEPTYPGGPSWADARDREEETRYALAELDSFYGVDRAGDEDFKQWDIPDNAANWDELRARCERAVAEVDLVIAPAHEPNGNAQHNMVAAAVESAWKGDAISYLTYTPLGRSNAGREVPFEPHWPALKMRALACYRSQIEHPATAAHFLDGGLREYVA